LNQLEQKLAIQNEYYEQLTEWEKEYTKEVKLQQETRQGLINNYADIAKDAASKVLDFRLQSISNELESLDVFYQTRIEQANAAGIETTSLEAKYQEERRKLEVKQLNARKVQEAINIGIETTKKIFEIKANAALLASNPVTAAFAPFALAQIPILAATSAIALGSILSQQIPEFWKGTTDAPETFIAGDRRGRELIFKPDGSVELTPDKATLFSGEEYKHSTILPNHETERMINGAIYRDIAVNGSNAGIEDRLDNLTKTIKNKKEFDLNIDEDGFLIRSRTASSQTTHLNKLARK
jgi:hypothetical protein